MNAITRIFNLLRNNGRHLYSDALTIRHLIHLNLIWTATYSNFCFFTLLIVFFNPEKTTWFVISTIILHIAFLLVFLLNRKKGFHISRHLFLLTTYTMLFNYDHYFGYTGFTFLYYISFLPTAFNIFSFKNNRTAVLFYTMLPVVLMLLSSLYTYNVITRPQMPDSFLLLLRCMNIIMAYVMAVIYSSYMVFNPGSRQTRLITQSVALQTTLDNAVGAIWSIDKDYRLLTLNKQFVSFVENEFQIKDIRPGFDIGTIVKAPSFPQNLRRHYERVLSGENLQEEFFYKNKVYEIKAVPIVDENNVILGATFTSRDISYKKEAEAELVKAMLKAEEAVQAKTRFLSNMSHEIRTPLNGISGITNILLDEEHLPSQRSNFETLGNLTDHTLQLINNILDLSKIEAGKAVVADERFHLLLLVDRLRSVFENTAKYKKNSFRLEIIGNADIYLKGDEVKLNQVLFNLLGNAVKFTEEGLIKLTVVIPKNTEFSKSLQIKFLVEDNGIGIKKEDQQKIFESFTQADSLTTRKYGGTGLGITISEKLLNLMGSHLQVESEYGKGSRFWFEVVLNKSSFEPVIKNELNTSNYDLAGVKILIAEDNKVNQMVAKKILEKWKAEVIVVENGLEAFQIAISEDFDVILMDLDMPVMDGYESVLKIRNQKPSALIVALTAAAFDDMYIYLQKKGFDDVVQKPFKPYELYRKIAALIKNV